MTISHIDSSGAAQMRELARQGRLSLSGSEGEICNCRVRVG
jgi:hypothetical protein